MKKASNQIAEIRYNPLQASLGNPAHASQAPPAGGTIFQLQMSLCTWLLRGHCFPQLRVCLRFTGYSATCSSLTSLKATLEQAALYLFSAVSSKRKRSTKFSVSTVLAPKGPSVKLGAKCGTTEDPHSFELSLPCCVMCGKRPAMEMTSDKKWCYYVPKGRCQKWQCSLEWWMKVLNEIQVIMPNSLVYSVTKSPPIQDCLGGIDKRRKELLFNEHLMCHKCYVHFLIESFQKPYEEVL